MCPLPQGSSERSCSWWLASPWRPASLIAVILGLVIAFQIRRQLGTGPGTMARIAASISEGDLTVDLGTNGHKAVGAFAAMKVMTEKLQGMVATVQETAEQVASASEQITASAQRQAGGRNAKPPRRKRPALRWKSSPAR